VNFSEIGRQAEVQKWSAAKWEAEFALKALMEVPEQYAIIVDQGLLGSSQPGREATPVRVRINRRPSAANRTFFSGL
jgi:hypothetical protein